MVMIPVKSAGKVPEGEREGKVMAKQRKKGSADIAAEQKNNESQNNPDQDMSLEELISENEQLKETVERLREEKKALQERVLRVQADGENFRKRITREKEEFSRYAKEEFIREILPIKDNLERALEHGGEGDNTQAIIDGINMILEQFSSIFEKMGVSCLTCCGEKFDPNFHEAMMHQEAAGHEPNTVIAEHQKGYLYQGRLLRPALVTVAKAQSEESQ